MQYVNLRWLLSLNLPSWPVLSCRYLIFALLNIRDFVLLRRKQNAVVQCDTNLWDMIIVLLRAFSSCRCALKCLVFPVHDGAEKDRASRCKLLEAQHSAGWLTLSVQVAAAAVSDVGILWQGPDSNVITFLWSHVYDSVVSTCQIIRNVCGDVFNQEARSLLIFDKEKGSPDSSELVDANLSSQDSLPRIVHALHEQLQVFLPSFTSVHSSLLRKEGESQLLHEQLVVCSMSRQWDWFGGHVVLSAVSCYFWSMVSSLDAINEMCHDKESRELRWQAELPKGWLLSIQKLEPILVKSLLSMVAPGESAVVFIDNLQSTEIKTSKQHQAMIARGADESPSMLSSKEVGKSVNSMEGSVESSTSGPNAFEISESEKKVVDCILSSTEEGRSECIGQLFSGLAALLRVRSLCFAPSATGLASKSFSQFGQADRSLPPWVQVLLRVAYWLLEEVSRNSLFGSSSKGWLLGVVQFTQSMGGLLSCVSPKIPVSTFGKLVDLHMKLLGSLAQFTPGLVGRGTEGPATCGSQCGNVHDMAHTLKGDSGYGEDFLVSLKYATEMSFVTLLKDCPRQHFVVALHLAEKSVVAAPVSAFGIEFTLSSGEVGRPVAAGVQSMALVLKAITSRPSILSESLPVLLG